MSAPSKKPTFRERAAQVEPTSRDRRVGPADGESSVYDGREKLGDIVIRKGEIIAKTAAGKRLGVFDDERQAMRAIYSAARPTREAQTEANASTAAKTSANIAFVSAAANEGGLR